MKGWYVVDLRKGLVERASRDSAVRPPRVKVYASDPRDAYFAATEVFGNKVRRTKKPATHTQKLTRLRKWLMASGKSPAETEREIARLQSYRWASRQRTRTAWFGSLRRNHGNSAAPSFTISARPTRGGYRGVASLGNGVVALKTMPVFREKKDALDAIRAWVAKHGARSANFNRRSRFGSRSLAEVYEEVQNRGEKPAAGTPLYQHIARQRCTGCGKCEHVPTRARAQIHAAARHANRKRRA